MGTMENSTFNLVVGEVNQRVFKLLLFDNNVWHEAAHQKPWLPSDQIIRLFCNADMVEKFHILALQAS